MFAYEKTRLVSSGVRIGFHRAKRAPHRWRDSTVEGCGTSRFVESGLDSYIHGWPMSSHVFRDEEPAELLTYRIERLTLRSKGAQTLPLV